MRAFPPVSQVQSTLYQGVIGFHQLYFYVPVKRRSPVLDAQLVPFVLNQEANTTGILLTIDNPIEYIREAHLFAAFSRHLSRYYPLMDRPVVLRWLCADVL